PRTCTSGMPGWPCAACSPSGWWCSRSCPRPRTSRSRSDPAMTVPDWLARRDGSLKPGLGGRTRCGLGGGAPQYRLDALPAAGKCACAVTQTVNGRRLDDATTYPSADAALAGGLEQLRARLGW